MRTDVGGLEHIGTTPRGDGNDVADREPDSTAAGSALQVGQVVGHVDGVLFQRLERHHFEGALMGGGQYHRSRAAIVVGP
ncbi:hypothetical protein I546_5737 [Mycobacterium kansasii 732]|nr:hypothetical protein I546_5737 [Mycobacterium kansasii 732]